MEYPTKIACCEDNFETEFKKAFASISQLLLTEFNGSREEKRKPKQLAVLKQMLEQNNVQYPHLSQFIQILLCTPPNTSPVESGYTYLQMVAAKQRNHLCSENMETLFMLASLKLPSRKLSEYEEEIKLLEEHLKWRLRPLSQSCFICICFVFP